MSRIRAVFFDMSGTLHSNHDIQRALLRHADQLVERYGLTIGSEEFARAFLAAMTEMLPWCTGRPFYRMTDFFPEVTRRALARFGVPLGEAEGLALYREQVKLIAEELTLHEGVMVTLAELRRRGLTVGIVSVNDEAELSAWVAALELTDAVDFVLSSEIAQSCKPDAAIYQEALRRAGCAAEEVLFVGDMPDMDIAGANRMGMTSVLLMLPGAPAGPRGTGPLEGDRRPDYIIHSIPEVLDLVPEPAAVKASNE